MPHRSKLPHRSKVFKKVCRVHPNFENYSVCEFVYCVCVFVVLRLCYLVFTNCYTAGSLFSDLVLGLSSEGVGSNCSPRGNIQCLTDACLRKAKIIIEWMSSAAAWCCGKHANKLCNYLIMLPCSVHYGF